MSSPAVTASEFLENAGIGVRGSQADWSIHTGTEPLNPARVVTVYDTGGAPPVLSEIDLRVPSIQVRVRSDDYELGWEKANEAHRALVEAGKTDHATTVTIGWFALGDVFHIGRDENDNHLFTCNFEMMRQHK